MSASTNAGMTTLPVASISRAFFAPARFSTRRAGPTSSNHAVADQHGAVRNDVQR